MEMDRICLSQFVAALHVADHAYKSMISGVNAESSIQQALNRDTGRLHDQSSP